MCDYGAYVFCSLPLVRFFFCFFLSVCVCVCVCVFVCFFCFVFACLLLLFLLLIWHHERGLGLLTGITDSGALFFFFFFFFFELVIYKHYGLSRFFVYICITLTSFCRTALGRSTKL